MILIKVQKVSSHKLQPIYCSNKVGEFLPFTHKRVRLEAGEHYESHEDNGTTVVSIKVGAGASEEPIFKTDFTKQVLEAIKEFRIAACKRVNQQFVDGFDANS